MGGKRKLKIPEKELWRIDEVAKFFDVTEQTIRIWINEGKIKHYRVYKSIRIPRYAILDCIQDEDSCSTLISDLYPTEQEIP